MRHASLTAQITHPQDRRRTRTARLERKLERACSPADPLAADMPRYCLGAAFGVGARFWSRRWLWLLNCGAAVQSVRLSLVQLCPRCVNSRCVKLALRATRAVKLALPGKSESVALRELAL